MLTLPISPAETESLTAEVQKFLTHREILGGVLRALHELVDPLGVGGGERVGSVLSAGHLHVLIETFQNNERSTNKNNYPSPAEQSP